MAVSSPTHGYHSQIIMLPLFFCAAAISEELYFSSVGENFHSVPNDKSEHGANGGLGGLSNLLTAEYLGGGSDHRTMESPSASVSGSVYSRTSGTARHNSIPEVKNEF